MSPRGLVAGPDGSVYIADSGNRNPEIAPDGTITTIAGVLGVAGSDDGVALTAHLNTPSGIDVDASGQIFIADTGNSTIRMITTDGKLITIVGIPGVSGFADGAAASAKFAGPAESSYERLLHGVASLFLVVQNAPRYGQERGGVMLHQLLECKVVAGAESVDEISIVDEHRAQRSAFSRRGGH